MNGPAARIAVVLFPGTNCEGETARAVEHAGMTARIVRWNERIDPGAYNGYILPGGWSYEDRIRAGAIAAHDAVMSLVRDEVAAGKPVLGICNGAQILAEANLVPGSGTDARVALAPNAHGYRCAWVSMRLCVAPESTPFTGAFNPDDVVLLPVAHGEGRFETADEDASWVDEHTVFQYCDEDGTPARDFPQNPNGSMRGIAGLRNQEGNVLALMPHPERASWRYQFPAHLRHRTPGPTVATARKIFVSLRDWLERAS